MERHSLFKPDDNEVGENRPYILGPMEEACGILESIHKLEQELRLTFAFRQIIAIELSSRLFKQLVSLQGQKIGLLYIGNNQYKIRKFNQVIAEA